MNKIVFIGIILITGLFSLQFLLIGKHGANLRNQDLANSSFTVIEIQPSPQEVQVVYICPEDSATIRKLRRAQNILL